ncbi:MAG: hypothetical protein R3F46_15690 [bacterium]
MRGRAFTALARTSVRVCLLLLFLTSQGPVQFVLCHEAGELPRLEQAVNGQCLTSSSETCSDCCSPEQIRQPGTESLDAVHRHCTSCQDQVLHPSPGNRLARVQNIAMHNWLGGCLYSCMFSAARPACGTWISPVDRQGSSPPTAAQLVAETTCLLI